MLPERDLIKAGRLQAGDTVALVAPASPQNEDEGIRAAIETVESLGFRPKAGAHLYERWGYLAGSDAQRAADLNAAFADERVDGIICIGGGWGSARILPALRMDVIRANPKVLLGYSDITALLNGIYQHTGLVTFHGPIGAQTFSEYTFSEFKKVVMDAASDVTLGAPPPFEKAPGRVEKTNRVTRIRGGVARGPLAGGNLSLMATLCGTPWMPDLHGRILFLEEVGEATYRVDRMLTQLWLSGALGQCAGIVFGKFTDCKTSASWAKQLTIEEILRDRCEGLGIPVVRGLMIGHVEDQTTLPLGCQAELDADGGTLTLLEAGVLTTDLKVTQT
jgi:muramoyltetrapeptide carboxypeptidase